MSKINLRAIFLGVVLLGFAGCFGCSSNPKTETSTTDSAESDSYGSYESSDTYTDEAEDDTLETYGDIYSDSDTTSETDTTDTASTWDEESTTDDSYSTDTSYDDYSTSDESTSSELVGSEEVASDLPEKSGTDSYSSDSYSSDSYGSDSSATSYGSETGGETVYYTVQKGDTLMEIAFAHYGNYSKWQKVFQDNNYKVQSPELLQVGTVLTLENVPNISITKSGDAYVIEDNDTLMGISQKIYGTTAYWRSLQNNNPELIKDPNKIYAGMTLYYDPTNALSNRMPTDESNSYSSEETTSYDDTSSSSEEGIYYEDDTSSSDEVDYSDF